MDERSDGSNIEGLTIDVVILDTNADDLSTDDGRSDGSNIEGVTIVVVLLGTTVEDPGTLDRRSDGSNDEDSEVEFDPDIDTANKVSVGKDKLCFDFISLVSENDVNPVFKTDGTFDADFTGNSAFSDNLTAVDIVSEDGDFWCTDVCAEFEFKDNADNSNADIVFRSD